MRGVGAAVAILLIGSVAVPSGLGSHGPSWDLVDEWSVAPGGTNWVAFEATIDSPDDCSFWGSIDVPDDVALDLVVAHGPKLLRIHRDGGAGAHAGTNQVNLEPIAQPRNGAYQFEWHATHWPGDTPVLVAVAVPPGETIAPLVIQSFCFNGASYTWTDARSVTEVTFLTPATLDRAQGIGIRSNHYQVDHIAGDAAFTVPAGAVFTSWNQPARELGFPDRIARQALDLAAPGHANEVPPYGARIEITGATETWRHIHDVDDAGIAFDLPSGDYRLDYQGTQVSRHGGWFGALVQFA